MPAASDTADVDRYRLPRVAVPRRYELSLEPDLVAATFTGAVVVDLDLREPVDELVLNALELEVDEAWVVDSSGERLDATVSYETELERARLALSGSAPAGPATLHARYRGVLNDKLTGFYRSTFTDADGNEQLIATTQMEATHARKAFPCWDEPEYKAVFSVTLLVPEHLAVLSNARGLSSVPTGDGRRLVTFADTPPMSTYLVAFVVGPLVSTTPVDVDGVPLRIAHVPGKGHLAPFAADCGAFALRFFTDYYGLAYAGDKVDLVAIPDFAFGAMENLGCITFREVALLVDPDTATQQELQRVADVINHELAHMWFGDLVTMRWWNGIWLNEAFATFMEMKCTDAYRPDWQRWVDFGLSRSSAFDTDSLSSTRPVEFEVVSPDEAEGMFDVLTYEKGAAVLRMLEQYLGEDSMRDGIRQYLATHAFGNTETTDLWDAIESVTGQPVRRIMDSWIFQGGYPMVGVELLGDGRTLRLTQERFRFEGGATDDAPAEHLGTTWAVPLLLASGTDGASRVDRVLLDQPTVDVELDASPDWLLANAGGSGFYRARYAGKLLHALVARADQLSSLERYGLVDDTFASVLAGTTTSTDFLDFARGFGDEPDLSVWQRLAGALRSLSRLVDGEALARYQTSVRALAGPALLRLGWEPAADEDGRQRELRATLVELAGVTGNDEHVQAKARQLHQAHLADPAAVDPALARAALWVVAETGDADDYETILARYRTAPTPQEERRYLFSLARFHDDALFGRTLDLSMSEVRSQDAPFLLQLALANRSHGSVAWQFLRRNWDAALRRFPDNTIVRMLEGITTLTDPDVAHDVHAFFAEHEVPQGQKTLAQHLERLRVNVALRQREGHRLAAGLT